MFINSNSCFEVGGKREEEEVENISIIHKKNKKKKKKKRKGKQTKQQPKVAFVKREEKYKSG